MCCFIFYISIVQFIHWCQATSGHEQTLYHGQCDKAAKWSTIIISNLLSVCLLLLHCINRKITGIQWMFIKQWLWFFFFFYRTRFECVHNATKLPRTSWAEPDRVLPLIIPNRQKNHVLSISLVSQNYNTQLINISMSIQSNKMMD